LTNLLKVKNFIIPLFIIIVTTRCRTTTKDETLSLNYYHPIDSLIADKIFFKARDLFFETRDRLSTYYQLRAGAVIDNAFNKPGSSNQKIELLFRDYSSRLPDSVKYALLDKKQANHGKLFEYKEAYRAISEMQV
jgi:hypothetical protein